MDKYCVYFHSNKITSEVFYVGIGNLKRPHSKRSRSVFWHNVVKKHGYVIEIIHTDLNFEKACELEKIYIAKFGKIDIGTGILVNLTNGGEGSDGYKHSDEIKAKIKQNWANYRGFELPEDVEEYNRKYAKEFTRKRREREDVKEKYRKYSRDKYNNMSDEEKEKHRINKKNYRDNLSEEQKKKNKEYKKIWNKNMTEEQKENQRTKNRENMAKKRKLKKDKM